MPTALSNSLYIASPSLPGDALPPGPVPTEPAWFFTLMAVGIVLMLIWTFRRIASPGKLALDRTPGRNNQLTPLLLIAMLMLAYSVCALLAMTTKWAVGRYVSEDHALLLAMVAPQLCQIPAWLAIGRWGFNHGLAGMGFTLRRWPTGVLRGVTTGLIAIPICYLGQMGIVYLAERFGIDAPTSHPLLEAVRDATWPWRLLIIIMTVVLAPLSEELLFRGLIQSSLRRFLKSPWAAIVVTSVLFGVVHLPLWSALLPLAVFGVLLGYSYERTGKLLPAIVAHAVFNAANILVAITSV